MSLCDEMRSGSSGEREGREGGSEHTSLELVSHSSILVLLSTSDGTLLVSLLSLGVLLVGLLEFLLYLNLGMVGRGSSGVRYGHHVE